MEKPWVISWLEDGHARELLKSDRFEQHVVTSSKQLCTGDFPRRPRLFLLQFSIAHPGETKSTVETLRRDWPLAVVVLWAPQASGATVRAYFQLGVKDVLVSRSVPKLVARVEELLEQQRILPQLSNLNRQRTRGSRFEGMLSRSGVMWDLFELCTQVATTDATVLIVGETGTGKELLARALHRHSGRRGRFVAANCASTSPDLVNSELFGHEKGAFTGADRSTKGLVMHANKGTLFLDEIGDMPPEAQQSLLRMLQEKRIRSVGSLVESKVDVRIVAATNVALDQAVKEGRFREDLFYRLDVIRMNVPPLRKRADDILFLFGHFTKRLAKHYGLDPPTFADSFLDALVKYDWPGNVRQLENFSERLVLARPRRALTARSFEKLRSTSLTEPQGGRADRDADGKRLPIDPGRSLEANVAPVVERTERAYLETVLAQHRGRVAAAAHQAGISRRTLLRKMKLYGIKKEDFRSATSAATQSSAGQGPSEPSGAGS